MDPAEVPTTTSAVRESKPATSSSAARAPTWNARPAAPPAPRTRPTRGTVIDLPPARRRRSLLVEGIQQRLVLLRHDLALHLQGGRDLPRLLREVPGQDGEPLDGRVARQPRVQGLDG